MEMETTHVYLRIKDNILIGTYKQDVHITLDIAKEIVRSRISFTRGATMPCIILSDGIISIDKAARNYLGSTEATLGLSASAIISKSAFSIVLGNFFLKLSNRNMPVKLFRSSVKAEQWLQQFIEQ